MKDDKIGAFSSQFEINGAPDGPLYGLSCAAKDLYDIAGYITGAGNPEWVHTHTPANAHAPMVAKLLTAGARLVGKTHTDELAYSLAGMNAHYGSPLNVAAPQRVTGGSSSGSAAAVAAELVDFALGTDTGGSVRLPASFCGLYGIRPTHGLLSLEGVVPLAPSFDTPGWFARDIELMIRVGAVLGIEASMQDRPRLATPADLWALAEPDVSAALEPALDALQAVFGAACSGPLNPDSYDAWREVFRICQGYEAWASHKDWISAHEPKFGPGVAERFEAASKISAGEAEQARSARQAIAATLDTALKGGTVIVMPTAPTPAPRRDADSASLETFRVRSLALLCPAGLGGLPQLSIPAAVLNGMPVGFSLLGPRGSDGLVFAMAREFARRTS